MARPRNTVRSGELRLAVSPSVKLALEKIASTGLYGLNPNEVAVRLIESGLRDVAAQVQETRTRLDQI